MKIKQFIYSLRQLFFKRNNAFNSSCNNFSKLANINSSTELYKTSVGDFSYIGRNSIISHTNIGKYCSLGPNLVIGFGDHPTNLVSTSPVFYQSTTSFNIKPKEDKFFGHQAVNIGNDVWIGANCVVRNGIKIGDGAIIGAGAVITKDVPPYAIVVGVPGRVLKYRFENEIIEELLLLKWWNWDLARIEAYNADFSDLNITNFIKKHLNNL